ncbi:MAG: DJ-1/PfpI family protein [Fibromonadaceae bacterium]|jgi:4-methyl-5(b-hydroxyethyl)-thiazole monophosphate biosynthesis|nr:DJ-1/PfpI family protein [Fibromonadaceae bacterium]
MTTALFLLANGFEELEFVAPYDILHRGGVKIQTASIDDKKEVMGAHGLAVLADSLLSQVEGLPFDLLVLPGGGPGTENLLKSDSVKNLLVKSYEAGKQIAAICAAPKVLVNAGILRNHSATSYPSVRADIEPHCKRYLDAPVVISENIITSKGAGAAAEFGFCLLSLLAGPDVSANVKGQMKF